MSWSITRIKLLSARAVLCYQCPEYWHLANRCQHPDCSKCCYSCEQVGHGIGECTAKNARCVICEAAGLRSEHRLVSAMCTWRVVSQRGAREKTAMFIDSGELSGCSSTSPDGSQAKKADILMVSEPNEKKRCRRSYKLVCGSLK